jgi:recombination protein RecA
MYGEGISKAGDILDSAVEAKIVQKAGSWYSFEGERIGQGRENVKIYLKEHPEVMDKIEGMLLDQIKKDEDFVPEPDIPEEDISEIMDMFVDDDGVVIE